MAKTIDELSGVQVEELQEGDEEMEEVEEIDNGGGVGAFLAPPREKMAKKTLLKKASTKNISVKPESSSGSCCLATRPVWTRKTVLPWLWQ